MAQYDVDLREYWRIIKKRKGFIILLVFIVGICSYGFAKIKEPVPLYESNSAVKIESTTNLATALMGGYWAQKESLDTHAFLITSFPILKSVANAIGWINIDLSSDEVRDSKKHFEVINRLKRMIMAEVQAGTNVINIKVISNEPDETAFIANSVATTYRNYNIQEKNRQTFETKAFIEEQVRLTSIKLIDAENALKTFKEENASFLPGSQKANILSMQRAIESEIEKLQKTKKEFTTLLNLFNNKSENSLRKIEKNLYLISPDSPVYSLKQKLTDLIIKRQNLLVDFTNKHPSVVEVNDLINTIILEIKNEFISWLNRAKSNEIVLLSKLNTLKNENMVLPEKSLKLIRLEREVKLQEELNSELKSKYQEITIHESGRIEEVTIVKPALIPSSPFNVPSKLMIVVTGIVMGLILGIVFAFGAELFDTSIGTIEDVEEVLGVPVLGVIPSLNEVEKRKIASDKKNMGRKYDLVAHYDPSSLIAEAFRTLRTNLQFISLDKKVKSFVVTSSFVQEGKSFNVVNLALSLAQTGNKVLLISADLRKPVLHKIFGLNREPGLTDYVLGNYQLKEIINTITDVMLGEFELEEVLKTPGLDNLHVINCGVHPPNPAEILRSERFKQLLEETYDDYDIILIDTPPVLPVVDAAETSKLTDGTLIVYMVGKIGRGVLKRAKITLENVNANVTGIILNNIKPESGPDYFRYQTQYYYGKSSGKDKTG